LKVLVLGDCNTGKTSLIKRCVYNVFATQYNSTVGVDFSLKKLNINGCDVRLQLWDIAGQDRFGSIARVYYKDAHGAMLVYDVTHKKTFDNVIKWKREVDEKVELEDGTNIPVLLLGNKCDLEASEVPTDPLEQFCTDHKFIGWMETSAKKDTNVQKAAETIVAAILKRMESIDRLKSSGQIAGNQPEEDVVDMRPTHEEPERRKKKCC